MVTANQKSTIDTQIRKSNPNTSLKIAIKPQEIRRKKTNKIKFKTIDKMAIRTYILIITYKCECLNAPTKRHRLDEWIQKQDSIYTLSTRDPLQF